MFYEDWMLENWAIEYVDQGIAGQFFPNMPEDEKLDYFLDRTIRGQRWAALSPLLMGNYSTIEEALNRIDACDVLLDMMPDPEYSLLAERIQKMRDAAENWLTHQPRPYGYIDVSLGTPISIPDGSPWRATSDEEEWNSEYNQFEDHHWTWESNGHLVLRPFPGYKAIWQDVPDFDEMIDYTIDQHLRIWGPTASQKAYLPLPEPRHSRMSRLMFTHRLFFNVRITEKE